MNNYRLIAYKKGGKYMIPNNAWRTEEYLEQHCSLFMTEHLVKGDWGRTYHRYRLRTCEPTRFTDTLEYDIECPVCHDRLRLCGLPLDSTTHGLYKCRHCDKEAERRS